MAPILARLEAAGILVSRYEDVDPRQAGRPRRRYYRFTPDGADLSAARMDCVRSDVLGRLADAVSDARRVGGEISAARAAEMYALRRAEALARVLYAGGGGIPEAEIVRLFGVDRMTVRKWLGKRR